MITFGKYYLKYKIKNIINELLVEVKIIMNDNCLLPNQNIYYGEVYINDRINEKLRIFNTVNAKYSAEEIGLKMKNEIISSNKNFKVIKEYIE